MIYTYMTHLPSVSSKVSPAPSLVSAWGARWPIRVGIMGGSFNPAHQGHLQVAQQALRLFQLDQLWLLVSPGNPLKKSAGMSSFEVRLASAQKIADGRRIVALDIEKKWHTRYTIDTVKRLRLHFPLTDFVWIMGADGLAQLPQWKRWNEIVKVVPMGVFPRPGYSQAALHSQAAYVLRRYRLSMREASLLAGQSPPSWFFSLAKEMPISSTKIRAGL